MDEQEKQESGVDTSEESGAEAEESGTDTGAAE